MHMRRTTVKVAGLATLDEVLAEVGTLETLQTVAIREVLAHLFE
jgi:hypothetical protein